MCSTHRHLRYRRRRRRRRVDQIVSFRALASALRTFSLTGEDWTSVAVGVTGLRGNPGQFFFYFLFFDETLSKTGSTFMNLFIFAFKIILSFSLFQPFLFPFSFFNFIFFANSTNAKIRMQRKPLQRERTRSSRVYVHIIRKAGIIDLRDYEESILSMNVRIVNFY